MTQEQIYTNYDENDIIVTNDMILDNDKIGVHFTIKYENKEEGYKAYEFRTQEDLYFEFYQQRGSYFRLEITKDYASVLFALRDEYQVMEDVSDSFDIVDLLQRVLLQNDITDVQDDYDEWWEEEKEDDDE
ncbi:hypothetical protein [Bacillus sp. Brlt_9]|uniref:hypothetical protein n=1 Tax=Bacillus sp. Brlt_9 TaxID=3110916 RepID=UPI003F7B5922